MEKISQTEKSGTNNCGSFTFLFIVEYYIEIMVLSDTLLIVGISTCTALLGEGEFLSKRFDSFLIINSTKLTPLAEDNNNLINITCLMLLHTKLTTFSFSTSEQTSITKIQGHSQHG